MSSSGAREISYLSDPNRVSMADTWYEIASVKHFWFRRRLQVLRRLAGDRIRSAGAIAEIGCGNGVLQRQIEDEYGIAVAGFDMNVQALKQNVSRKSPLHCYDIHDRAPQLRSLFDLIFLFDVIEHISEENAFLDSLQFHLAEGGSIVVNVPACQGMYSDYDRVVGHLRRYSIGGLAEAATRSGLRVAAYTYWGLPLMPLLLLRKILIRGKGERGIVEAGLDSRGGLMNAILLFYSRCEPIPQKFAGASLMAMLERQSRGGEPR